MISKDMLIRVFKEHHDMRDVLDWTLPIQVCRSGAGYYIGQMEGASPYSRLSCQYWETEEEAQNALDYGTFEPRLWA